MRLYLLTLAGAVVLAVAAYCGGRWVGYGDGVNHEREIQDTARRNAQAKIDDLGERVSEQASELLALQREREDLVQSLEDAARAAPGADNLGVGADGVRRLEQRWGAS